MIYVNPGETRNFTVDGAPTGLAGQVGWRLEDEDDQVVVARTTAGTTEFATGAYRQAITMPDDQGLYVVIVDFPSGSVVTIDVEVTSSAVDGSTFAARGEVAQRLGRDLTVAEEAQVDLSLLAVAGLIREAAGKAADWEPDPVPPLFKALSIEKVIGVVTNPQNLASLSEQLGAYQQSQTFPRAADIGIFLTDAEERRVARAVHGTNTASSRATSELADEAGIYYDIYSKEDVPAEIVDP